MAKRNYGNRKTCLNNAPSHIKGGLKNETASSRRMMEVQEAHAILRGESEGDNDFSNLAVMPHIWSV